MTDPISDMLTRIRNAKMRKHDEVYVPFSKMKQSIARILKEEGFIRSFKAIGNSGMGEIKIALKYSDEEESVITELKRISKPGRRVYIDCESIPSVKRGLGIVILSTSKGVMTGRRSRKENVGGEVLCYVW